ncbi:piggyBac transposable element-derived protein 4-like [Lineus longissimus]|uniref:piggyBac transposable element-derived protein 4-like n=1 Tax=Lineus longissimus TaxID=88925 RepID=UPI002B4F51F7
MVAKGDQLKDNSRAKAWKPTTPEEMNTFLGLILLMGVVLKPRIHMYWATDELVSTPIFSQAMTRDRFQLILKFFHFANNEDRDFDAEDPERDRLHKVGPVIEMIRTRMAQVYSPGKNLSIDESLVLYKGRLAFRQFIRTKRARFGIKLYELCTSSGITLDFMVYCGKGMIGDDDPNDNMSITERIPANLMIPYLGEGHCLFIDNFYTSPKLADHLLRNGTYVCGTINPKRKNFSRECANANLDKGGAAFYKQNDKHLLGVKFRAIQNKANNQPKLVCMLSTAHRTLIEDSGKKDRQGVDIRKPSCILSYNKQMGGVDRLTSSCMEFTPSARPISGTESWFFALLCNRP